MTEAPYVDAGPRTGPDDSLLLDIGGDVGALIIYTAEALVGAELDLTPAGQHQHHGIHTVIRRRRVAGRDVICGVYPQVRAGLHTVWGLDGEPLATVRIEGGRVAEVDASTSHVPQNL